MAERVKVYEETKKKSFPVWAWLLPLLLLLGLLIFFLTRRHDAPAPQAAAAAAAAQPSLGTVYFDTDKADLTVGGTAVLQQAVARMKADPNIKLRLQGYTDSTGIGTHNNSLSGARAAAVAKYLIAQGIDAGRLSGAGFGPEQPAATNATAAGKADNRRVELYTQQ